MSDYVPPGGFYANRGNPRVQSVYYPARPSAAPLPQMATVQTPEVTVNVHAPSMPMQAMKMPSQPGAVPYGHPFNQGFQPQQPNRVPSPTSVRAQPPLPTQSPLPVYAESSYAAAGWGALPYHYQPSSTPATLARNPNNTFAQMSAEVQMANAAAVDAAKANYERALANVEAARGALENLGVSTEGSRYSQTRDYVSLNEPRSLGFNEFEEKQPQAMPTMVSQSQTPSQTQVRFAQAARSNPSPISSGYRFEETTQPAVRKPGFSRVLEESVYLGLPNTLTFAANRPNPGTYHYAPASVTKKPSFADFAIAPTTQTQQPQRQISFQSAEAPATSEVATAVMDAPGGAMTMEVRPAQGMPPTMIMSSSDYHFDDLRGMQSA